MIWAAVVARAANGVIGNAGAMPWRLPADLARFKALTLGKPVLMGRKTFASIGRPLPGRTNLVLTRDPAWRAEGVISIGNLEAAVEAARQASEMMVIGGAEIYALTLPRVSRIELTDIDAQPEGDTWLPPFNPAEWREVWREAHGRETDRPAYAFVRLERC